MVKPELALVSVRTSATTYSFQTIGPGFRSWALCTVNDATGELLITSDYGNWTHRWDPSPRSLGAASLTEFIGDRGDVDYLARKLQREGRNGQVFSSTATVKELRKLLCHRRLEDGRERLDARLYLEDMHLAGTHKYDADGLPYTSNRIPADCRDGAPWNRAGSVYERLPYLTRDKARCIWKELGDLADDCGRSADLFYERISGIDGVTDYITEEPWHCSETEQTPEDKALRDIVLPALIDACRKTVADRQVV